MVNGENHKGQDISCKQILVGFVFTWQLVSGNR